MSDINYEAVTEAYEVGSVGDKAEFWRAINDICNGTDEQKEQKKQKGFSVAETLSEQNSIAIKTYCSFQPLQNEIAEVAESLIGFAST